MTIIFETARVHARHGGITKVIVSAGTRHDYTIGDCVEVAPSAPPNKWQKGIDLVCGRLGFDRPFGSAAYRSHSDAIPDCFNGTVFIHNDAASITRFRREHPQAQICLWANNELFATYGASELRRVYQAVDLIICCSRYVADQIRSRLSAESDKIKVVHSGVDTHRFHPRHNTREPRDPVILFVGRVQPIKGPDLLLKASLQLAQANRQFKVRIVGSSGFSATDPLTPYEVELRDISDPIRDLVEFQPFIAREAILAEYQQADIFCVPSNWNEPLGLTVLEGMACGLPTVASRRGGIPEIGGAAALYFDPPNVDQLVEHLAALIDDRSLREARGIACRAEAEKFNWITQYGVLATTIAADERLN